MEERDETEGAGSGLDALREFVARLVPGHHDVTAQIDAAAAEVLTAFEAAGVDVLLLKGAALAALLYEAGEQRLYSDADLLVAPGHVATAEESLAALGYSNADSVTGVDDVGGVVHGNTWIRTTSMIDLHRWLPGSRIAPDLAWRALMARRTWIEVAGHPTAVLDRSGQALHLATHAAQHGPAFGKHLDELALALERWPPDVWNSAALLAQEIDAAAAFAAGLRLLPIGAAEASRLALPSTAELDWTIRQRAARPRGTFHVQALADAESPSERFQILRRSLFPRRAWITYQHPWAEQGQLQLIAAYGLHVARAPFWAARAWWFRQRARRAGRAR